MARKTLSKGTAVANGYGHDFDKLYADLNEMLAEIYTKKPSLATDSSGNVTGLVGPDGAVFYGSMVSGSWMKCPSIFRLRLTGTGTVTIDAKDSLGNITAGVASYTVSGATDQIEFPYAGDNAVAIRAVLTGDATCEVI